MYWVWLGMKARCYNPNRAYYKNYGGRGIGVCAQWKDSFVAFREWAESSGYKPGLELDRRDNNKDYTPDNCQWSDRFTQANNRRNSFWITAWGEDKTAANWAKDSRCSISRVCLIARIRRGWPAEKAVSFPHRFATASTP